MEKNFVKIRCTTDEQWRELQQQTALDLFPHTAKRLPDSAIVIDGLLTNQQIVHLRAIGYAIEVLAGAQQVTCDRQREIGPGS